MFHDFPQYNSVIVPLSKEKGEGLSATPAGYSLAYLGKGDQIILIALSILPIGVSYRRGRGQGKGKEKL